LAFSITLGCFKTLFEINDIPVVPACKNVLIKKVVKNKVILLIMKYFHKKQPSIELGCFLLLLN
jgi:hypothetical protein